MAENNISDMVKKIAIKADATEEFLIGDWLKADFKRFFVGRWPPQNDKL
jgi:hypothetical protein